MARQVDAAALARAIARVLPPPIEVREIKRVTGGASRETWLFDAHAGGAVHHLVLRRDPGEHTHATDRETEYRLLAAAARAGVPAPRVVMLLHDDDGLGRGFVMERVDGETIPRKLLRDDAYAQARALLPAQLGGVAARIHAVPVDSLPPLSVADGPSQVAQYRDLLDAFGEPHPALELGLRWLQDRAPEPHQSPRLVHGDYRNGNFIVGAEGLRAVLDWELAHLGDPAEDLGWLCVRAWRFGHADAPVGGFGAIPELLAGYAAAGGEPPDPDTLRWWIALGTLKWGVMCMAQAFTHIGGHVRSVELATIGRRVSENEHDLLLIMDGGL